MAVQYRIKIYVYNVKMDIVKYNYKMIIKFVLIIILNKYN